MDSIKNAGITMVALYAAAYALRFQTIELRNFKPSEFGVWFPLMNTDLLVRLDLFRDLLGVPVLVSPAAGAIGRMKEGTQHAPNPFVNAIDLMVPGVPLTRQLQAARDAGFSGIGLYPDWEPHPGIHVDVRPDRTAKNPAMWSGIKTASGQEYFSIDRALT